LNDFRSVRYRGKLETTDPTSKEGKPIVLDIEIIFQKPSQQRITLISDKNSEITALDDYEGWQRQQNRQDPSDWKMTLMAPDQVKRVRVNVWENFAFFRGIEARGGRVEDRGLVDLDGKRCHKIDFVHEPSIVFERYFDPQTGQLLLTEATQGSRIREEGEIRSGGLRFPRRLHVRNRGENGQESTVTINETFPPDIFQVPALAPR
jgi:hypothetical protein